MKNTKENQAIKNWMIQNYKNYLDLSDCLNTTLLAEAACDEFDDYLDIENGNCDIPEIYYEIAVEVDTLLVQENLINS
jgi:hypothetical protein